MDPVFENIVSGTYENRLYPFMWLRNGEHEQIPQYIETIQRMGQNALCVESRTHEFFCEDEWWEDMGLILSECGKRGMGVWLLDDKRFPTGYANGAIRKKYPECRGRTLIERSVDVVGPVKDAYCQIMFRSPSDRLLGVYAYRRMAYGNEVSGEPICLNEGVSGSRVYFELPDGIWRICYFIHTTDFIASDYINMVDEKSCEVLIREVYESHYEHFGKYFGNTFRGFFSDEPAFRNDYYEPKLFKGNPYDRRIGDAGLALPYSEELLDCMRRQLGEDPIPYLYGLWYDYEEKSPKLRHCFMDCATRLYQKNFSRRIGDWCRRHGVEYIGHVIEDNGCHTRMAYGAGHYFRAVSGQSMSGIDVVLHQVEPGFSDRSKIISFGKFGDGEFFHYGLAKLASSASHMFPHMKNRALCEIFGAYGWAESIPLMKWLCDFMLVRGINHFVPHAFSLKQRDMDSPPHFNAAGFPQKEGYRALMDYMNKMSEVLIGGVHICDAAILYHAELEWWNYECMPCEKPAKQLYDSLMDYDFVDMDTLKTALVSNKRLVIHEETYACLIIPHAASCPSELVALLEKLSEQGLDIIFINERPAEGIGRKVMLEELAGDMLANQYKHIRASCEGGLVRFYHKKHEDRDVYMFFNEAVHEEAELQIYTDNKTVNFLDLANNDFYSLPEREGKVISRLEPYQSVLVYMGDFEKFPEKNTTEVDRFVLSEGWNISLYDTCLEKTVKEYKNVKNLFNMNCREACPEFAGRIVYHTDFVLDHIGRRVLVRIKAEGQTVEISVNGSEQLLGICKPYVFDMTDHVRKGRNVLEICLCNTMANKIEEKYTSYLPIYASGLTEAPVVIIEE